MLLDTVLKHCNVLAEIVLKYDALIVDVFSILVLVVVNCVWRVFNCCWISADTFDKHASVLDERPFKNCNDAFVNTANDAFKSKQLTLCASISPYMYCCDTLVNVTYETDTIHAFVIVIFEKLPLVHITLSNVPIDAFMRHVLTSIDVIFDEGAGGMTNKKKDDEYYLNHTTYIFLYYHQLHTNKPFC